MWVLRSSLPAGRRLQVHFNFPAGKQLRARSVFPAGKWFRGRFRGRRLHSPREKMPPANQSPRGKTVRDINRERDSRGFGKRLPRNHQCSNKKRAACFSNGCIAKLIHAIQDVKNLRQRKRLIDAGGRRAVYFNSCFQKPREAGMCEASTRKVVQPGAGASA